MKKLLLVAAGLLGLCSLGQGTALAGTDQIYDEAPVRRPVYHERYDDGCAYYPRRTVVVAPAPYYAPGYYGYGYRPHYYRRAHVGLFLPVPPLPLPFVRF